MSATRGSEPPSCSVVIPTHNRANWLPGCVASARAGGIENLEIVVVDDGSTDDTREVVATLGPDVRYVRQPNLGVSAARNRGVRESRASVLAFLDSDDRWLPGEPRTLFDLLRDRPRVGVGFANALTGNQRDGYRRGVIEYSGRQTLFELPCSEVGEHFRVFEPGPFFRRVASRRQPMFTSTVIVRREAFDAAGGFDERLRAGGDVELWIRLAAREWCLYLDRSTAIYEQHAASISNARERSLDSIGEAFQFLAAKHLPLSASNRAFLRSRQAEELFDLAYRAYDRGDLATARRRFARSLKTFGFRPRPALYWCACWLGPSPVRGLRRVKRWFESAPRPWGWPDPSHGETRR